MSAKILEENTFAERMHNIAKGVGLKQIIENFIPSKDTILYQIVERAKCGYFYYEIEVSILDIEKRFATISVDEMKKIFKEIIEFRLQGRGLIINNVTCDVLSVKENNGGMADYEQYSLKCKIEW